MIGTLPHFSLHSIFSQVINPDHAKLQELSHFGYGWYGFKIGSRSHQNSWQSSPRGLTSRIAQHFSILHIFCIEIRGCQRQSCSRYLRKLWITSLGRGSRSYCFLNNDTLTGNDEHFDYKWSRLNHTLKNKNFRHEATKLRQENMRKNKHVGQWSCWFSVVFSCGKPNNF